MITIETSLKLTSGRNPVCAQFNKNGPYTAMIIGSGDLYEKLLTGWIWRAIIANTKVYYLTETSQETSRLGRQARANQLRVGSDIDENCDLTIIDINEVSKRKIQEIIVKLKYQNDAPWQNEVVVINSLETINHPKDNYRDFDYWSMAKRNLWLAANSGNALTNGFVHHFWNAATLQVVVQGADLEEQEDKVRIPKNHPVHPKNQKGNVAAIAEAQAGRFLIHTIPINQNEQYKRTIEHATRITGSIGNVGMIIE